jgi:hypothetical protein
VIATLAAGCRERDVLIASVDQDYYQLLRDAGPGHGSVRVLNTARRAGSRLAGPAEVRAKHGVDPVQLIGKGPGSRNMNTGPRQAAHPTRSARVTPR